MDGIVGVRTGPRSARLPSLVGVVGRNVLRCFNPLPLPLTNHAFFLSLSHNLCLTRVYTPIPPFNFNPNTTTPCRRPRHRCRPRGCRLEDRRHGAHPA